MAGLVDRPQARAPFRPPKTVSRGVMRPAAMTWTTGVALARKILRPSRGFFSACLDPVACGPSARAEAFAYGPLTVGQRPNPAEEATTAIRRGP